MTVPLTTHAIPERSFSKLQLQSYLYTDGSLQIFLSTESSSPICLAQPAILKLLKLPKFKILNITSSKNKNSTETISASTLTPHLKQKIIYHLQIEYMDVHESIIVLSRSGVLVIPVLSHGSHLRYFNFPDFSLTNTIYFFRFTHVKQGKEAAAT